MKKENVKMKRKQPRKKRQQLKDWLNNRKKIKKLMQIKEVRKVLKKRKRKRMI